MQISLKIIRSINHAKSIVCIKFQLLVTFSSLFTASSSLPVFPPSVLYILLHLIVGVATAIGLVKAFDAYDDAQEADEELAVKDKTEIRWMNIKKIVEC